MPDDDELEQELRQAGQLLDPVPARLMADAVEMFSWRTIDAELAELAFDSAGAQAAAAVRGAEPPRLLTFEAAELSIELELAGTAAEREITGRLIPAQRAGIEIRLGGQRLTATADVLGRFEVTAAGPGPISLRFRLEGPDGPAARQIVTEWVTG
jgi:hypothetical protein